MGWVSAPGLPGVTSWPAQTYDVSLQVTAANPDLRITEVKIYRTNSSGGPQYNGLAVVGDLKDLSTSLGSVGTLTF